MSVKSLYTIYSIKYFNTIKLIFRAKKYALNISILFLKLSSDYILNMITQCYVVGALLKLFSWAACCVIHCHAPGILSATSNTPDPLAECLANPALIMGSILTYLVSLYTVKQKVQYITILTIKDWTFLRIFFSISQFTVNFHLKILWSLPPHFTFMKNFCKNLLPFHFMGEKNFKRWYIRMKCM